MGIGSCIDKPCKGAPGHLRMEGFLACYTGVPFTQLHRIWTDLVEKWGRDLSPTAF